MAHLIFKCLAKCAIWLFHRVKDEQDKAKITPWVCRPNGSHHLLTYFHSYESCSRTLLFNYNHCSSCESTSFSPCVHPNLHPPPSSNKTSPISLAISSCLVNSSGGSNNWIPRDLCCYPDAVISCSTIGVKWYKPPTVNMSSSRVFYLHNLCSVALLITAKIRKQQFSQSGFWFRPW